MSRYTAKQYATALFESLLEKGVDQAVVVKRFAKVLVGNYDKALVPKIAMQLRKLERAQLGRSEVVLTSARPLDKATIAEVKKKVGENSGITEIVDPLVLGGLKVLINDELVIDGTYQGRISKIVEQVIKF